MPESNELARLIGELREPDPARRSSAAAVIFERGRQLAAAALSQWLADPAKAEWIVRDASGLPRITVGVAVQPESFERILAASGAPPLADVPPDQDAREFELDFDGGARLDVLTTRDSQGSGAIARFLAKFGEGIQQVEIEVRSADRATELLRTRFGLEPVYPATRAGAGATRVNFFLAPSAQGGKVLLELVESPAPVERPKHP